MLLINLAEPKRMGMISHYSAVSLPISIGMLAGYLISKGREVKVVDELTSPIDDYLTNIKEHLKDMPKPYVFAISCLTINFDRGIKIARLIKSSYPDSVVIFGGIHPTILPEETLNSGVVDIVVRGEGEETLLGLYDSIRNKESYMDIEGISFKDGSKIKHNPARLLIKDIDEISHFPYELFDTRKYNLDFVMSSRGCPFDCAFCSQRMISGRTYRFRSKDRVIAEIGLLVNNYKQKFISFLDDSFLINKQRVKDLCALIVKNKFHQKTRFGCQTRADTIDREILGYLKEAGFSNIGLGIETGSERLMKLINKGETVAENIRAVKLAQDMGFFVSAFFLYGLPSETREERMQGYFLAKGLKLPAVKFNNIVPYPGTRLYEIAKKEGSLNIEKNWKNFNSVGGAVGGLFSRFKLPYVPEGTSEMELKMDLVRVNLYFYLSNLSSPLALLRRKNTDWFSLPEKWYLDAKEYYYLIKLGLQVLINAVAVFNLKWLLSEISWKINGKELKID